MKLLILGELYSTNLGDGIICESVKKIIQTNLNEKIEIIMEDISCRNEYISEKNESNYYQNEGNHLIGKLKKIVYKFPYITYKRQIILKNKKIKSICDKKYDLVIFAGGNLFMDYFVLYISTFVKYFSKNKTPIIFNACGAGNIKSKILLRKLRKTLNNENVKVITSRDNVDKINKEYIKSNKKNATKTYDPAICASDVYGINKKMDSKTIGLGVMKLSNIDEQKIEEYWLNIISELEKKNIGWQIFCNGEYDDYMLAKKISIQAEEIYGKKDVPYLAQRPTKPKELVELIANYNKMISFRLHSHIIAYSLQIPSLAIVWDEKVKGFFKNINHDENCFLLNDDVVNKLDVLTYKERDKQCLEQQKKELKEILIQSINDSKGERYSENESN